MTDYQIRVRCSWEECKDVFEKLSKHCVNLVVYQHDHQSNVHCHAYVTGLTIVKQTFYNWCDKLPSITDRSHRTLTTQYKDETEQKLYPVNKSAISYFSQGSIDPVFSNFPPDIIQEWKSKGYAKYKQQAPVG